METQLDATAYQPMIDAILSVADLERITVKKIRNALSELFSIDFTPHKKQMNDFILQRYYALAEKLERKDDQSEDNVDDDKHNSSENHKNQVSELERKRKLEQDDRRLAEKLQNEASSRKTRARGGAIKKVKRSKANSSNNSSSSSSSNNSSSNTSKRTPNTAFNAELSLSNALQQVVGQPRMSRPMVVKRLWEYIKEHQLQSPDDKRRICCDDKLMAIFKKTSVGMFEMNRDLGSHLFKDEDLVDGSTESNEVSPRPKSEPISDVDE